MVDLVADYWETMRERQPLPDVKPGYIWDLVPKDPPAEPEPWSRIFADIEPVIFQGTTHWQHPHFFAYYPSACSYPAIMGDILSGGIASIGFTWKSSPAMTELEMVMTDWIAKAIGLPRFFLNSDSGPGAGMIQCTASDATLIALLSARARAVMAMKQNGIDRTAQEEVNPNSQIINFESHDPVYFSKLVAYCSDQAHSAVDKGIMLAGVRMRKLKSTKDDRFNNYSVEPNVLEAAIKEDRAQGYIPFIYVATVGTTNTCGIDSLTKLGPICNREKLWLHVDAAYAGSFALCPEFRYLIEGVEMADSFNFNCAKSMMINFDYSPMWFKDAKEAINYFNVDPTYLKHEHQAVASDYRHLQVALGRRFRALKVWFVLRSIGTTKIQENLRIVVNRAIQFAKLIEKDEHFELFVPQHLGLGSNDINERLNTIINDDKRIHLVPANAHGIYFLRVAFHSSTTEDDVKYAYDVITELAEALLKSEL
uniref:Aromatic-L-amino-acid decarboxylase n=1 Tax=Acrobeloides nanus TaxID=290746 RepID=A0A914CBN1_9BILA